MILQHAELDKLLTLWRDKIGSDWQAYRNHTYRLLNYVNEKLPGLSNEDLDLVAIAAAYHDVGIWLDKTFDYLEPSSIRAQSYLKSAAKYPADVLEEKQQLVNDMVMNHHRVRPVAGGKLSLVNVFRQADWCDVSFGRLRYGLAKKKVQAIQKAFPDAGFHLLLVKLAVVNAAQHPFNPLPMMRW
jgi:hypothetical protein